MGFVRELFAYIAVFGLVSAGSTARALAGTPAGKMESATPEMVASGAVSYARFRSEHGIAVQFYDERGPLDASCVVEMTPDGAFVVTYTEGGESILSLVASGTNYELRDLRHGVSGGVHYDRRLHGWRIDPEAQAIASEHPRSLGLAASCLAVAVPKSFQERQDDPRDRMRTEGADVACNGSHCRGWGTGSTRSYCCAKAYAEMAGCCSNRECWGRCSILPCDAGCAFGDYLCVCGQDGTSCAPGGNLETTIGDVGFE